MDEFTFDVFIIVISVKVVPFVTMEEDIPILVFQGLFLFCRLVNKQWR